MPADDFPQPIFILAPPRSFTSLVCGVIGQHPQLLGSPELNLFRAQTMRRFLEMRRLHMGLQRFVAQVYAGEQSIEAVEMANQWMAVRTDLSTGEVHRELCAKIAPFAMVQKSPRYMRRLTYLQYLLDAFPEARFIHLLRHPYGTSQSFLNLHSPAIGRIGCAACGAIDASGEQIVADPQILWHDYHLRILRFQERVSPDRWLRIKGEDFLSDLDNQLQQICEWLGISTAPEAIAAMKHPEDSPFACFGPPNARIGNDPNFLESPQLRPYRPRKESLAGQLPWRDDGAAFHPRVVTLAKSFGYS